MSTCDFKAEVVSCYTENDVDIIGIGNDPIEPDKYIIISRLDEGDSPDESIGLQSARLGEEEISSCIQAITVSKTDILVAIKPEKVRKVGDEAFHADLSGVTFNYRQLVRYLKKITAGSSIQLQITK